MKSSTVIKITASIRLPKTPNFLVMDDGTSLPIDAATDAGLQELGEEWTRQLLKTAQKRRLEKLQASKGTLSKGPQ